MADRTREGLAGSGDARRAPRRASRPRVEGLESRDMPAILAPIANVTSPTGLGYQVPLDGGADGAQTYTVTSSNTSVKATVAKGQFLTIGVSHTSSGTGDVSFTGSITIQLFGDLTPNTVAKITQLVTEGFYTSPTNGSPQFSSKNFHRIANNFPGTSDYIVQGGSQSGTGSGSLTAPGFPFADEFNQQLAFTGTYQIAMANAGDDTNDSQFFFTTGSPRFLDFQHTIFGQVVSGQETIQQMTKVALGGTDGTTPVNPILMTSTTLSDTNPDGVIHVDTTGAAAGQASDITVTARDAAGGSVTRTFKVNVSQNLDSSGQPIVERPFLSPVANQVVGQNQTAVFQIQGVAPTAGDPLTYGVGGGTTTGTNPTFSAISNGTASVDANGVVTVIPTQGFTGTISLLVGVRDQTNRVTTSGATIDNIGNYDTQKLTLTVNNGSFVNLTPIASPVAATVGTGRPTSIQLAGNTANPNSPGQTLQYTLLSQPSHGTISDFDATTGKFSYLPNGEYQGTDTFTYSVTDVGAPTPNLTSNVATVAITVGGADTGAVRVIDGILVITPLPAQTVVEKKTNTIQVNQVGGTLQVRVNGILDVNQPSAADISRIVVYGSKASDTIRIGQEIVIPTTLDGGHGGVNKIFAGGAPSTMFGWFRTKNVLKGSPANDRITGRQGYVKFLRSGGKDKLFAGEPNPGHRNRSLIFPGKMFGAKPHPPGGTFYRFVGKVLVPIKKY